MADDVTSYRLDLAEQRAEKADQRMGRIEDSLNEIKLRLAVLPTKGDLLNYVGVALGIGLAIMALTIGGIIGGLDWIKTH